MLCSSTVVFLVFDEDLPIEIRPKTSDSQHLELSDKVKTFEDYLFVFATQPGKVKFK